MNNGQLVRRLAFFMIAASLICSCRGESRCGAVECSEATYTYMTDGDCELQADVFSAPGDTPTPAILWIHPGGLMTGSRQWIDADQLAMYLEAGYTVVTIDHRLAPEYKLRTIASDIESAYAWLIEEGPKLINIDPERVAVVGHSAGGYLALLSGYRVQPRPKALVTFYGYGDLTGDWAVSPSKSHNQSVAISRDAVNKALGKSSQSCIPANSQLDGRFDLYLYSRQQGTWPFEVSGYDPAWESDWLNDYEPVKNVTSDFPPTLLLHGGSDTDVPFAVAEQMAAALKDAGVPYELVSQKSWNHAFDQMEPDSPTVQTALEEVMNFLNDYVK